MKSTLFSLITFVAFSVLAAGETKSFRINKMHCGGCVASINKAICKANIEGIDKCSVKLIDKDEEYGTLTITTKEGMLLTPALEKDLASRVEKTGYVFVGEYKPSTKK